MNDIINKDDFYLKLNDMENFSIDEGMLDFGNKIQEVKDSFVIFNHSQTEMMWKKFNLNHLGKYRNLRQCSAELQKKYRTLMTNYFDLMKLKVKYENNKNKDSRYNLKKIEYKELEWKYKDAEYAFRGASKDFNILYNLYKELKESVGEYTEEDVNKDEINYYAKRLTMQAMRDILSNGRIHEGNQETLENMGLSPVNIANDIMEFLEQHKNKLGKIEYSMPERNKFLESICEKYSKELNEYYTYKEVL